MKKKVESQFHPSSISGILRGLVKTTYLAKFLYKRANKQAKIGTDGELIDINYINQERFRLTCRYSDLAYWLTVSCAVSGFILIGFLLWGNFPKALIITAVGLVLRYYQQLARQLARDALAWLDELAKELRDAG